MGGIAEKMLIDSIAALVRRDTPLAQAVIAATPASTCSSARSRTSDPDASPCASRWPIDLRETISAIRISNDLERIGDLAKNIAKRALAVAGAVPAADTRRRRPAHGRAGPRQLKDVLDAYARRTRDAPSTSGSETARSTSSTPPSSASC